MPKPGGSLPRRQTDRAASVPETPHAFLSLTGLKARGWTAGLITSLLGAPDQLAANPHYRAAAPMRLYRRERVEAVEASAAWAARHEAVQKRKDAAGRAVQTRQQHMQAYLEGLTLDVPMLPGDVLTRQACAHYNRRQAERYWEEWREATPDSDPAFLARITVNYVRHGLSRYEQELEQVFGKVGVREAYAAISQKVYGAIGAAYPTLAGECARQLREKLTLPAREA
jgi:hypothetical protein